MLHVWSQFTALYDYTEPPFFFFFPFLWFHRSAAYARQQFGKQRTVKETEQPEETTNASEQTRIDDNEPVPMEKEKHELSSTVRSLKRNLGNLKKGTKGRWCSSFFVPSVHCGCLWRPMLKFFLASFWHSELSIFWVGKSNAFLLLITVARATACYENSKGNEGRRHLIFAVERYLWLIVIYQRGQFMNIFEGLIILEFVLFAF